MTAIDYDSVNHDFGQFSITSHFDWRYLWKGGRAGLDQVSSNGLPNGSYIDMYDGTFLMPGGVVYDTHNAFATPLQSDKYSFYRTTSPSGGLNEHQYGSRSFVNATYGSNGTGSNIQDLQYQMQMVKLEGAFLPLAAGYAGFVGSVADGGIGQHS